MRETIVHSRTVSGLLLNSKPARVSHHPLSQNTKLKENLVSSACSAMFSSWLSVHVTQRFFPAFFVTSSKLVSRRSVYIVFQSPGSPCKSSNH